MNYYPLSKASAAVDFKTATIKGQAPDKSLYFPETLPKVDEKLLAEIETISFDDFAFEVMKPFVGGTIDDDTLRQIVNETINFPLPLQPINDSIASLELFHGPTLAFKDVGARFMSRCLGHFSKDINKKITVLVATSGDTGGAVANAFHHVEGVEVVILYPSGKVSEVQELQLTTLGGNIKALEIDGSFDDCQAIVKTAFTDAAINQKLFLTSANSINVARWLPQQLYYWFAWKQWKDKANPPVICVPSGNFGNICAGMIAWKGGLPVKHFIAACNANDVVPQFLQTGNYQIKKSVSTISNAMDVANPSNFVRIMEMLGNDVEELKEILSGFTVTDNDTKATIKAVYEQEKYMLDPHGAVAYNALEHWILDHQADKGIILETAHPVKFPDTVEACIGEKLAVPEQVQYLFSLEKQRIKMEADYDAFKGWLLK